MPLKCVPSEASVVAQWVKLCAMPTSPVGVLIPAPPVLLLIQLAAKAPGRQQGRGRGLGLCLPHGDSDGVLGSRLQPSPDVAVNEHFGREPTN